MDGYPSHNGYPSRNATGLKEDLNIEVWQNNIICVINGRIVAQIKPLPKICRKFKKFCIIF